MATTIYKKVNFVDRLDNKPTTYLIDGKEAKIVKDDSGVVTHGTNLDQENLDHVENGILQNSRDISMLDKVIEKNVEENTTKFEEIKSVDDKQDKMIKEIEWQMQFCRIVRMGKDDNGIFKQLTYFNPSNTKVFESWLSTPNAEGLYTKQEIWVHKTDGTHTKLFFKLMYDSDGDLVERRFDA